MSVAETAPSIVLEQARDYVARGFSVIPVERGGKKPVVEWMEFQSRRATEEELVAWFSRPLNIGIVTGKLSGLTVIDCDSDEATQRAAELGLPTTAQVKTGKGWHFYYAFEPDVANATAIHGMKGIDIRGEGGFVVAPPSVHESGAAYRWEGEHRTLPVLPPWVTDTRLKIGTGPMKMPVTALYAGAVEGSRNDSMARLIGAWANAMPIEFALPAAMFWNERNNPPLPYREVERTVRSIYAKQAAKEHAMVGAGWISEVEEIDESGIVRVADLLDKLRDLYINGLQPGVATGWPALDGSGKHDRLYSIRKGEWTVLTGIPGHGKSTFLDQLMVQVAKTHGWKFAVFSAENRPVQSHVAALMEKLLDKPFNDGPTARINSHEFNEALRWLNEFFYFLEPDDERQDLKTILHLADHLIAREGISGIVIDPWNELDHSRPAGVTETEYISVCLSTIRRFARTKNVHVFVVAHPKMMLKEGGKYPVPTPYDISGSAHWRNKADNALSIFRNDGDASETNSIYVQKIRFREVGKLGVATLWYDIVTGRFRDSKFERWTQ